MGWQLIESQSLSASAASVTFSNIPQTYKTIKLAISSRSNRAVTANNLAITFNNSGTGYSERLLRGDGASVISANQSIAVLDYFYSPGSSATSNTFSNIEITIPNYAGSTNKPVSIDAVTENNATTSYLSIDAGLWSNSAAITSVKVEDESGGNFVFGSTFTLYGLA